jgi:hypothetical protein
MACPGSIRLSKNLPDKSSVYAQEGTAAHELAERCLRENADADAYLGDDIDVAGTSYEVTEEMAEAVQLYLDTVRAELMRNDGPNGELLIEHRFDLSDLYPGMFGTNDAAVYHEQHGRLVIFDYKHGRGHAVEAFENPQLLYYGYGAASTIYSGKPLREIELVIVQPRAPHKDGPVRRWVLPAMDLLDWSADLLVAAEATENPTAPLVSGDHCQFCKAAAICPQLREDSIAAAKTEFTDKATELSPEQLRGILDKADMIEDWLHAVRAHALTVLEGGGSVPGYKLVEKRAFRKWRGEFPEADLLRLGFHRQALYTEKPLSPAQLEKKLAKPLRDRLAELTVKESSGYTLAAESDGRPAKTATNASNEFTTV